MKKLLYVYLGLLILSAVFAPFLAPFKPLDVRLESVLQPPSSVYWMGTDHIGRDVFSRVLYGARLSLIIGIAVMGITVFIGTCYGIISALSGGVIDRVMMRIVDVLLSIPSIFYMLVLALILPKSVLSLICMIAFTSWMPLARFIRMELLSVKNALYIQASTVMGSTKIYRILHHMLPQCIPTIIVMAVSEFNHAILVEATLSFFGIGLPPNLASWGNMLMGTQSYLLSGAWWTVLFPGIVMACTVMSAMLIGNHLQGRAMGYTRKEVDMYEPTAIRNT